MAQCRNCGLQLTLWGEAQACHSTAATFVVESEPLMINAFIHTKKCFYFSCTGRDARQGDEVAVYSCVRNL